MQLLVIIIIIGVMGKMLMIDLSADEWIYFTQCEDLFLNFLFNIKI